MKSGGANTGDVSLKNQNQASSPVAKPVVTEAEKAGYPNQITDVKAINAADTNKSFIERGWNAPYDPSTQVRQFTTKSKIEGEFVRVYAEGINKPTGSFLVRSDETKGMTPQQIQQHLALPSVPTHIADVTIPAGTKMQTGKVARQPDFGAPNKGRIQYELLDRIPETNFKNMRPLK